jgi:hypothetical protein
VRAVAVVDADDGHLAKHRWYCTHVDRQGRGGYVARTLRNPKRIIYLHRMVLGVDDRLVEVDHRNGDRLDNRRSNLRCATRQENAQNVPARGGASPHRGVYLDKRTGRWYVLVRLGGGKRKWLGNFETDDEAAVAARAWRLQHMPFSNEERSVVA